MKLILGSSSPRRKELLSLLTDSFTVQIPEVDETPIDGELPQTYSERITRLKSDALSSSLQRDTLLICADTIVTFENRILGKPFSYDNAFEMLLSLSSRKHRVMTSISLMHQKEYEYDFFCGTEKTEVQFKPLTHEIIEAYLSKIHFMDKAGSYAVQDRGDMLIKSIIGSHSNVMGFPISFFLENLSRMNLITNFFTLPGANRLIFKNYSF